jgi:hypothetical protein
MPLDERIELIAKALHDLGRANEAAVDDYSDELDQSYRLGRAASYYQAARLIRAALREQKAN